MPTKLSYPEEVFVRIREYLRKVYGYSEDALDNVDEATLLTFLPRASAEDEELKLLVASATEDDAKPVQPMSGLRPFTKPGSDLEREQFVMALYVLAKGFDVELELAQINKLTLAELIPIFRNVSTQCVTVKQSQNSALQSSIQLPPPALAVGDEVYVLPGTERGIIEGYELNASIRHMNGSRTPPKCDYRYLVSVDGKQGYHADYDLRKVVDSKS